jgi:dTDP-4-amino-4,6-dideoxygalactose transaminase
MSAGMNSSEQRITVPLLDLKAQYEGLRREIMEQVEIVCDSQQFILGPAVGELESKVASYVQCEHGIGMSSGTDALLAALMAIGVGPGDEVITTPYTFFATGGVITRAGARPVFCDIDRDTYNISVARLEKFIDEDCEVRGDRLVSRRSGGTVKALMPVHLYGQVADMEALLKIAARVGVRIIEDAAQAIGAEDEHGRRAGSMGDVGCFSFFPSKNLGAFGDGGMCTTGDASLAERLRVLRVHGGKPKYHHKLIGGNFRLDELQAAVLLVKLRRLDAWTERRQANAAYYDRAFGELGLGDKLVTPYRVPGRRHIYNQYVLRVTDRDRLRAHLTAKGVGTEIYYPVPLHAQECFSYLGYRPESFPEAMRASRETLAIPVYPELATSQLEYTVSAIADFYA